MESWEDVRRLALALPETSERPSWGNASWRVRNRLFVWERPLRPADLLALGDAAPSGAILVALDRIAAPELDELIVEAWLCQAPKRLAREFLKTR